MTSLIHFNAFEMNCVGHLAHGLWAHPDNNRHRYTDLRYWTDLAELLERGRFDALFLADVVGVYDTYRQTKDVAVAEAVQIPVNDPFLLVPAMALRTEHLGFAVTASTTYEHPFPHARRMSTLDHLTQGRAAWNVVTSYLPNAARNFGLDRMIGHDERYERAEEHLEVCYKLWEQSWESDAVVRDRDHQVYTDPAKVHEIDHSGKHFSLPGPHLSEPSPQRTPVLYQAGSSGRGRAFAAKHAECVFLGGSDVDAVRGYITDIRNQAAEFGRDPAHLKMFTGLSVIVAETEEQARAKAAEFQRLQRAEGMLAHYGGSSGFDLSRYDHDDYLEFRATDHGQTAAARFTRESAGRRTAGQAIDTLGRLGQNYFSVVGTPTQVADQIERWIDESGLDGFNLTQFLSPGTFEDFIDLVVPELQRRGRYRQEYEPGTFRERLFGQGTSQLPHGHPGARIAHR